MIDKRKTIGNENDGELKVIIGSQMSFPSMLIVLTSPFNTHTYTHGKTAHAQKLTNKMLFSSLQNPRLYNTVFPPKSMVFSERRN